MIGPTQTCSLSFNMWICFSTFERTMASLVFLRSDPRLFSYFALYNWHIVCKVHSLSFLVFLAGISLLQVPGSWVVDKRTGELRVSLPHCLSGFSFCILASLTRSPTSGPAPTISSLLLSSHHSLLFPPQTSGREVFQLWLILGLPHCSHSTSSVLPTFYHQRSKLNYFFKFLVWEPFHVWHECK